MRASAYKAEFRMEKKLKVGALISGGGSNLQAIIDSCLAESIFAEIVFVGTDNPDAAGLKRAGKATIPTFITDYPEIIRSYKEAPDKISLPGDLDITDILNKQSLFSESAEPARVEAFVKTRIAAEFDLLTKISSYDYDLLILAGYMRTFTPYFIDKINNGSLLPRIMNIHPALLPSFPGVNGYEDTFNYGCKVGGCTVHFIDYGEDTGPIIGQKSFAVTPEDTINTVKEKGLALEWQLFPECIQLYAMNRLSLSSIHNKTIVTISAS